jgi:cellulose synthase/poly-beta-1,6-N-acetylglucosamine synthase-like glycosyltransferase
MVLWLLEALQIILGVRVLLRLIRSAGGVKIEAATASRSERVSIIVPVLNETARIKACLDGLMSQSDTVAEILVVDGGSSDGTQSIVERYGSRDQTRTID